MRLPKSGDTIIPSALEHTTDKNAIIRALETLIADGSIAYPLAPPDLRATLRMFGDLMALDAGRMLTKTVTVAAGKWSYAVSPPKACLKYSACYGASQRFQFSSMQKCNRSGHASMWDKWHLAEERMRWLPSIFKLRVKAAPALSSSMLHEAIRYMSKCSQFPVGTAKAVYERYRATRVLDPCFGWGDRMAAALACKKVMRFHGIDLRQDAKKACDAQAIHYNNARVNKGWAACECSFRVGKAENPGSWPTAGQTYDTIFTSPPFFDFEVYGMQHKQELTKQGSYRGWLGVFLVPLLRNAANRLDKNGVLAVHMTDGPRRQTVCRDLLAAARSVPGLRFKEVLAMEMQGNISTTSRLEWIWVWTRS